jgi:cysteine-rich repeat protein
VCGNGIVEAGEECDDANAANADACLTTCQRPVTWIPSDVHVHSTGCSRYASPEEVAERLKGQGVQVGAALVWGIGYDDDAALFTGRDHPLSEPGFILHYDLEVSHFNAAKTGHLILLGLDSLRFSDDVYDTPGSGVPVVDWARGRRAPSSAWPTESTGRATARSRFRREGAACRGRSSCTWPGAGWTSSRWRWFRRDRDPWTRARSVCGRRP